MLAIVALKLGSFREKIGYFKRKAQEYKEVYSEIGSTIESPRADFEMSSIQIRPPARQETSLNHKTRFRERRRRNFPSDDTRLDPIN